ncbi:hypothetical protein E4S40_01705 [Algoriphagus kandeliae]|uniref:Uncharacterized protein n=1 Tax=Algoriphagus kandeliae TaxID=2562278 RepID=A0A4Y9QZ50_9BACT|nr:hypothetical protein [Algoriphagus kandeliae]TFV97397.1 hypothetical protein E4S40_01705 [Algoriphagus kandeliae]
MISYLKKFFTGSKEVRKTINGWPYTYRYSDKPVFFDPIQMLKELNFRYQDSGVQRLQYRFTEDPLPRFMEFPKDSDSASVYCKIQLHEKEFEVFRYVFKISHFPASHYRFVYGGDQIATFTRMYHQSFYHQNLGLKLATIHKDSLDLSTDKWAWEHPDGKVLFLEKFGYPQVWNFQDFTQIKQLIN